MAVDPIGRTPVANYYAFAINLKITAPTGQADYIARYEMQRRDDGGENKASWTTWERLPDKVIEQHDETQPAPITIYYQNRDAGFKPGWYYQYRCRGIAKDSTPGAWSNTIEIEMTDDTTAPDQPTVTVAQIGLGNRLSISAPTQDSNPCGDVAYCIVQGYKQGGSDWDLLYQIAASEVESGDGGDVEITHRPNENSKGSLGDSYKYRVKYVDYSKNSSAWSAETSYYEFQLLRIRKSGHRASRCRCSYRGKNCQ